MEPTQMYTVIGIFLFMIVSFTLNKWPFGLTTMTCCALLALTGIYPISKAFGGFGMKNLVLIAGMYVIVDAFGRTSLLTAIRKKVVKMQSKSTFAVLLILMLLTAAFAQFLPASGTITVMIMILSALSPDGELCPSRMLLPIGVLGMMWTTKIPIGMGATSHLLPNQFISGYGGTLPLLQITDLFKVCIIPLLLLTAYVMLTYKWLPKRSIDEGKMKAVKESAAMPKHHEIIVYCVFAVVMVSLFLNKVLGDIMYIIPACGAIILQFTKVESQKDMQRVLSGDMIFMLAGIFVMADALSESGAGVLIGEMILKLMGSNPSGLKVLFVFAIAGVVMTNLMTNSGCKNVLLPLAISTAVAAGWDPRGLALLVSSICSCACFLPSGAPSTAIAFAAGGYKLNETALWSLGFAVVSIVSLCLSINFFFPVM